MNAKVKKISFSVITAMFILALTAGTAYAGCGGFTQAGYVYYKSDGTEVDFDDFNMTIKNLNTGDTWIKGIAGPGGYTLATYSGYGYYKLVSECPMTPPDYPDDCWWDTGDVAEHHVWSLDGNYENTTCHTMTTTDFLTTGYDLNIYVESTAPEETFSKPLPAGWNLISLPLTNGTDMKVSNIIDTSLSGKYDALHKYDATTHNFVAMSSPDTMENGVGYFIHITTAGTWTYSGSAYTPMNVGLSQGLNMVGWLNCTKAISETSLSNPSNVYYIARWNATAQSYETHNPAAPDPYTPGGFNDNFFDMERGTGYFISAKEGYTTLSESC